MRTCYIVGAADGFEVFTKQNGDLIIAADAGLKRLEKENIKPDIAIGDFDSLGTLPTGIKVLKFPVKKDDTDTMLAVKYGFENGYNNFVIYGGTGGRVDHFLANLQTLNFIAKKDGIGFLCADDFTVVTFRNKKVTFEVIDEGNISIFATDGEAEKVTIKGLLYEADSITLKPFVPLGVSNKFISQKAKISAIGTLTVIFEGKKESVFVEDLYK